MLVNFENLIGKKILRIPDYQRGYSWDIRQQTDLWSDLENLSIKAYHFTGIITLEKCNSKTIQRWQKEFIVSEKFNTIIKDEEFELFHVVDGQQRLITLSIIIHLLLESFAQEPKTRRRASDLLNLFHISDTKDFRIGYEKDTPSHQFLLNKIFGYKYIELTEPNTLYTINLKKSKDFFEDKIKKLDIEEKFELFQKIKTNLLFNILELNDEKLDISLIFETLNYRGKQLSNLEILKNRLIYLVSKRYQLDIDKVNRLRNEIVKAWLEVYEWLGKNPEKVLKDDDFLRAFWIMYYKHDETKDFDGFANDLFYSKYAITDIMANDFVDEHSVKLMVQNLAKAVKFWFFINEPSSKLEKFDKYSFEVKALVKKINSISKGEYMKPLMMAILSKASHVQGEIEILFEEIERHNFVIFYLLGKSSDTNEPQTKRFVNQYFRGTVKSDSVINFLQKSVENNFNFVNIFNHIHRNRQKNFKFKDWNGLKYLLNEIEYSKAQITELNNVQRLNTRAIFPEEAVNGRFDTSWSSFRNGRRVERVQKLHLSLGNFVASRSNFEYESYEQYKRSNSKFTQDEKDTFEKYLEWTPNSVVERGLFLFNFINTRWKVNISKNEMLELLLDDDQLILDYKNDNL